MTFPSLQILRRRHVGASERQVSPKANLDCQAKKSFDLQFILVKFEKGCRALLKPGKKIQKGINGER